MASLITDNSGGSLARWDIFCRMIDNHGDIGVCWRLAAQLGARGRAVRLFVDDASALRWMAPSGAPGVDVLPWPTTPPPGFEAGDVVVEAFGCELETEYLQAMALRAFQGRAPVWINLEYLSAEGFVERNHGLLSPVMHGPAKGLAKYFFYPGFTPRTGGLMREPDLLQRLAAFERGPWFERQGVDWQGERVVSLFCYEPTTLGELFAQLAAQQPTLVLVTPGRPAAAVRTWLDAHTAPEGLRLHFLAPLTQPGFDELLWASDLNFVRGEDSIVRALWARAPFVWHIYPQDDGAHAAKLEAFLDWLQAGPSLRAFTRRWNELALGPLPPVEPPRWSHDTGLARERALAQKDLVTQLIAFAELAALPADPR